MKYVPVRHKPCLDSATITTRNGARVEFTGPLGSMSLSVVPGRRYYNVRDIEDLADGLRLLAADMRDDAAR